MLVLVVDEFLVVVSSDCDCWGRRDKKNASKG